MRRGGIYSEAGSLLERLLTFNFYFKLLLSIFNFLVSLGAPWTSRGLWEPLGASGRNASGVSEEAWEPARTGF